MQDFPGSSRMLGGARIALIVACGLVGALSCANSSHPILKTDGGAGIGAGGSKGSGGSGTDASADVPMTDSGTAPDSPAGTVTIGKRCSADSECESGFCTDGVCCQTACHDTCWTCSAQGNVGTCVPADVGTDPRNDCQDEGLASCGNDGTCDGSGACRRYLAGTICRQPTCLGSTLTLASRCQAGVCQPTAGLPCDPYVCDSKAGNACLSTCTGDADCGGGNVCTSGRCGKTPIGGTCTTNDDCNSKLCQQGYCCQTACTELCKSCAVAGNRGQCIAVPPGTDPLDQCALSAASTCGNDGFCDGKGACEIYSKATVCANQTCPAGGSAGTAAAHCDGMGTCSAAAVTSCNEYTCGTNNACLVTCRTNADCSPGNVCNGGICGKKVLGASCTVNTECATGSCQQGVCCDKVCNGTCMACNQTSSPGHCLPLPLGPAPAGQCLPADPSTCGNDGNCDGTGKCHLQATGTICKATTCSTAVQTLAARCDGMGTCVNGTTQPCDPFQCGTSGACLGTCNPASGNADCTTGNVCTPSPTMPSVGSCGKKPLGTACMLPSECGSNLCEGGVCCDVPCSGPSSTCKSCSLPGSAGKCTNVPAGQDPLDQCSMNPVSTCKQDGFCDGNGACRNYAATTVCVAAACTGATFTTQRTCDGAGTCSPATTGTCPGLLACDTANGVCKTSCTPATSSTDCVSPAVCSGTACVLKANGVGCGADNECATGFCEQGVCCASACLGTCKSCALPGATTLGICSNVPAATLDARCTTTAASTCGTDGTCDGNGNCHLYSIGTQCVAGSCPTGASTLTTPRTCDGVGNCNAATTKPCSPYLCDGVSACKMSCTVATTTADCLAPNTCLGTACGKKQTGVSCMGGSECASGFCSQNVCCDRDCSGTCQSCVLTGKVGTCSVVPAGTAPFVASQCPTSAMSTCGLNGLCDGSGNCQDFASGTVCVNQSCSGSTLTQPRLCNGSGTCQTSTSGACPGSFTCNGSSCRISCTVATQGTDCASPAVCTGNICGTVRVQYMCADTNTKTQSPHPQFKLINLSSTPINLSTLTIRYWFTGDGAVTFGGAIDFASNSAGTQIQSQMSLTFVTVSRNGADHYMQINYGAGAGTLTNASPVFAQSRFNSTNPDFGISFTQTGDYSFDPTKTALADWVQVTVYQNGVLIWGIEPN